MGRIVQLVQHAPAPVGIRPRGGAESSLIADLIAYYKLDEAGGNRADSHTGGYTLTDNNTVLSAAGIINNAALFAAASSEYLSSSNAVFERNGDMFLTWSCWAYLGSKAANRTIFSRDQVNGAGRNYLLLYNNGADRFAAYTFSAIGAITGNVVANALGSPAINTWYHIILELDDDNNSLTIRINDSLEDSAGTTGTPIGSSGVSDFAIGNASSGFMDGRVDEWGFWGRLLTATEKTNLYNGGAGLTYPFA